MLGTCALWRGCCLVGRSAQKANALATAIQDAGLHAEAMVADAESIESLRSAVDRTRDQHGRLDLLINCVGIQREELLADVSEEKFDEIYRVNLKAAMFLSQACARHQVAGGRGGAQVHLLSVRAQLGMRARGYSAYCATKGALVMLIKQHASELRTAWHQRQWRRADGRRNRNGPALAR